ncbi:SH3 domain-containing protein [Paracoccus spongiarum]|uniref:SH3 domain-containing protein n=1 Tax=Paracoccus spongiarum TaxID=3064387 RepID=A0ABT9JAG6_9RHOB|nr:SH3 domain-containing protein [Paracoccus sp. 2205BS29-5]MDP5306805.1 SH3 domain-containing protein [Paracoccus sp. 2205BS29-5]
MRLALFIAVTLAGLYVLASVQGSGNPRADRKPAPAAPSAVAALQSAAQDAGRALLPPPAPEAAATAAPEAAPIPAPAAPQAESAPAAPRFPGPPLRPSPEHAGAAPAPVAPPPAGATGPILYVTGSRVNFRAGPSTGDRVIGALDGGAAVEALGPTDGAWVNIRDRDGRIGYISGQFLSADAPG